MESIRRQSPAAPLEFRENPAPVTAQKVAALHHAIRKGSERYVREALTTTPELVNMPDIAGDMALHVAIRTRPSLSMLTQLLVGEADLTACNGEGLTPLQLARSVWPDEVACIDVLVQAETPEAFVVPSGRAPEGVPPAFAGSPIPVQQLAHGPGPAAPSTAGVDEPAVPPGMRRCTREASPNRVLEFMMNNMHRASLVDINPAELTPLIGAVQAQDADAVRAMLGEGFDPNERVFSLPTALMHAARVPGNDGTVLELLLQHHATVDLQDRSGRSALMYAALTGNENNVAILLAWGARADLCDKDGFTAMTIALGAGHIELALKLISRSGPIDRPAMPLRWTPLMFAAWLGQARAVEALLRNGAQINAISGYKSTALELACISESKATVRTLLRAGANPNLPSKGGFTPLSRAVLIDDIDMVEDLLGAGAKLSSGSLIDMPARSARMHAGLNRGIRDLLEQHGELPRNYDGECLIQ
jgi:ankyrin repeat protein